MRISTTLLLLCLLTAAPTLAQDADATAEPVVVDAPVTGDITVNDSGVVNVEQPAPEPEPTEEPRPIVETDGLLSLFLTIFAGGAAAILAGGGGLMILSRFLKRKDVRDAVEERFIAAPVQTQENILGLVAALDKALDIVRDAQDFIHGVTDGKPNEPTPPATP